ncbi:MAG: hypothetical protein OEY23_05510 [Acidimicrobiia bacterium]|nr:hypothetical protein [Acidimicrobiia bacterium]
MSLSWEVCTAAELRERGLTRAAVDSEIAAGRLSREAHGVYLLGARVEGHDGAVQAAEIALASHPSASVTGVSAAMVLGLDGFQADDLPIERPALVQLPQSASGRRAGARRRARLLPPVRWGTVDLSSVEEVLLELAGEPGPAPRPGCSAASRPLDVIELVELAVEDAIRRGIVSVESLRETVARCGTRRTGVRVLADVLALRGDQSPTESYLETRCIQELRRYGLPAFDRQKWVGVDGLRYRLDLCLADPVHGDIVIEPMGKGPHADRLDRDSARSAALTSSGRRVVPVTFHAVEFEPERMVAHIRRLLGCGCRRAG